MKIDYCCADELDFSTESTHDGDNNDAMAFSALPTYSSHTALDFGSPLPVLAN